MIINKLDSIEFRLKELPVSKKLKVIDVFFFTEYKS